MYDEEELELVVTILAMMLKDNISLEDMDMKYIGEYLSEDQILLLFYMEDQWIQKYSDDYEKNKIRIKRNEIESFKIYWEEITPYTILGIQNKEYSKEDLLKIVKQQIDIKKIIKDKSKRQEEIDKILDAYNEIIKSTNNKK